MVFLLLILFQLKHFLADYIWQNEYMLGKFKKEGWVLPLFSHASVHWACTFTICSFFTSFGLSLVLSFADLAIHFTVDRIKASPYMWGRYKYTEKEFWWALGADQTAHHLTHYAIIYFIMANQA